jgi:ArsR family transcriptional regulator
MKDIEKIYKALANRRRLLILKYLKDRNEASVGDIARYLKLSFKSTSRHLAVLKAAEILDKEQKGLFIFYKLNPDSHTILKHTLTVV